MVNNMTSSSSTEEIEFDWVQLHHDMEKLMSTETAGEKLIRKFKENPLVPIGEKNVPNEINT